MASSSRSARWKAAKGWQGWALLGVVVVTLLIVGVSTNSADATPEERVEIISKRLACPICDGESVFESRNNASAAIRNEIKSQVAAGTASDDEIVTFIEQRYGGQVLLVPKSTGFDALVWAIPVFAGVCAVAGLAFAFRRWKRAADTVPTDDDRALVAAALDADQRGRVDEP
jgi:cytochrome c-type biogenesis protein CcmH